VGYSEERAVNLSALRGVEDDETLEVVAIETPITSEKPVCLKPSQILNDLVAGAGFLDNSVDTLNGILDEFGSNQPSSFILEIDHSAGSDSKLCLEVPWVLSPAPFRKRWFSYSDGRDFYFNYQG